VLPRKSLKLKPLAACRKREFGMQPAQQSDKRMIGISLSRFKRRDATTLKEYS
jgi:hypothetical protein